MSNKVYEVNIATLTSDTKKDIAFLGSLTSNVTGSPWMTEIKIDNFREYVQNCHSSHVQNWVYSSSCDTVHPGPVPKTETS